MRIGIPREVKDHEHRVGLTPGGVDVLVRGGHQVLVERDAGMDAGFPDTQYAAVGARIDYAWDTIHIVTTFAALAFVFPHLLLIIIRGEFC